MRTIVLAPAVLIGALMSAGATHAMTVTSPDIKPGGKIADEQVFNSFGCSGQERVAGALLVGRAQGDEEFRHQHVRSRRADRQRFLALVGRQHSC